MIVYILLIVKMAWVKHFCFEILWNKNGSTAENIYVTLALNNVLQYIDIVDEVYGIVFKNLINLFSLAQSEHE